MRDAGPLFPQDQVACARPTLKRGASFQGLNRTFTDSCMTDRRATARRLKPSGPRTPPAATTTGGVFLVRPAHVDPRTPAPVAHRRGWKPATKRMLKIERETRAEAPRPSPLLA